MPFRIRRFTVSCGVMLQALCVLLSASASESLSESPSEGNASAAKPPPNIVLILSDDQSWTDYSFMGHDAIQTPNLDKLARQGATFRRGYVPTALCRPSLATLITGLYSHDNLVTGNDPAATRANQQHAESAGKEARELLISNIDRHPTVPRLLATKGYLSFQSGKWWEGSYQRGGFTHGMTRGYPERRGRHGDDGLKIGREGMGPVHDFIDHAVEEERPFFLWYAPFLPHTPHNPPARLLNKYLNDETPRPVATYYAMCEWFDETCGQLLDHLDAKGISDNTLVVYVTDNGWIQKRDSGGYAPRSKRSPYEGGTRTPIMFRWPSEWGSANRPELCSSIDIVPTMLAAAGVDAPKNLPGINVLPYLRNDKAMERDAIYGESFAHDIADIENPEASLLYRWVIRGQYKLLLTYDGNPGKMKYPPTGGEPQLYDLESDPSEKNNLAKSKPELVRDLSQLLTDWYPVEQRQVGVVRESIPSDSSPATRRRKNANRERFPSSAPHAVAAPDTANPLKKTTTKDHGTRPNILLLFADDQRNHTLGCAGHPIVKTPNIDQMASRGVRFENAFVSTSTCWVSRACLFTGCYERRHLYRVGGGPLDPELCDSSYFAVLKRAGYRTGHLGKEHVSIDTDSAAKMFDVRRKLGRNPYFKPQEDGTQRHETQILGDWAIEFLEQQPTDQPFCLTVSFNATHAEDSDKRPGIGHYPWPKVMDGKYADTLMPPPELNDPEIYESQPDFLKQSINRQRYFWRWDTEEKYQMNMRAYFRMLSGIDHVVGRLTKQLQELGMADNTVIIYTADNGYYLGDRGFAGKWTHYEQSLRVPMVIYDPRLPQSKRGRVLQPMVLNSDLASTMIELGHEAAPKDHTGRSLVPLIRGETPSDWRTDFLCEFIAVPKTIPRWEGVRDKDWVYARYFVNGSNERPHEFLHDLSQDPSQLINLVSESEAEMRQADQKALRKMRRRCDQLIAEHGPPMQDLPPQRVKQTRKKATTSK